ncbi:hypothetical protein AGDE_08164 [Angomonas deanei]|uniref:ApaG domain containing protein, putative n=1 Tax=Angomonas deanei TaxID=59799 RepID=A0A7G2C6R9_9TRYP|nr:hypothetical protein AGDE_08164 [Angomonas deanei]CAD2215426.1 ApaG domain containing protein, putative [Angomonas deanei]|eukprot:EPY33928.1 hypothetical protein AGDE_08164 [Angomonas deanei]
MPELVNAGYGNSVQAVIRSCFERPLLPGETVGSRTTAAFWAIKRLNKTAVADYLKGVELIRDQCEYPAGVETGNTNWVKLVKREDAATEGEGDDDDTQRDLYIGDAALFVEPTNGGKVRKLYRHCVVKYSGNNDFPYHWMLPPEPMYVHSDNKVVSPFPLMTDAIVGMVSTCRRLKLEQEREAAMSKLTAQGKKAQLPPIDRSALRVAFPKTKEDLIALREEIPVRNTQRTDFLEVEICSQYVCSNPNASENPEDGEPKYIFLYYIFIRNRLPYNRQKWHAHLMSHHLVLFDVDQKSTIEFAGIGVAGNTVALGPGESHVGHSGTSLCSKEGILRGTIQVNIHNETGEMRVLDIVVPPVRLSTSVEAGDPVPDNLRKAANTFVERRSEKKSVGEDWMSKDDD